MLLKIISQNSVVEVNFVDEEDKFETTRLVCWPGGEGWANFINGEWVLEEEEDCSPIPPNSKLFK